MRYMVMVVFLVLGACSSQDSATSSSKRDCDSLKGSARIMAMNCK